MTNNNEKHCEPNCDYKNYVRKGRGNLRCKDCDRDLTLELVLMADLKGNSSPTQSVEEKHIVNGIDLNDVAHSIVVARNLGTGCDNKDCVQCFPVSPTQSWEEEWELEFPPECRNSTYCSFTKERDKTIKDFISKTISLHEQRVREEIAEEIEKYIKSAEEETETHNIFENTENMNRVFMRVGVKKGLDLSASIARGKKK